MSARSPFHSWSLTRFQQIEAEQVENDAEEPQGAQDKQVHRHVLLLIKSLTRFQQIKIDQLENDAEEPQDAQDKQVCWHVLLLILGLRRAFTRLRHPSSRNPRTPKTSRYVGRFFF
jgi:hypothetical protein